MVAVGGVGEGTKSASLAHFLKRTIEHEIDAMCCTITCVLGPFKGGTSAFTACIRALGAETGLATGWDGYPTWENDELAQICRAAVAEPALALRKTSTEIQNDLNGFLTDLLVDCVGIGHYVIKHPSLCMILSELEAAMPGGHTLQYLSVQRDASVVKQSLAEAGEAGGWEKTACNAAVDTIISTRDTFLASTSNTVVKFEYDTLIAEREKSVAALAEKLGLPGKNYDAAIAAITI